MIRAGDTLVNPVSGETITFVETAAETGGDYTVIECAVRPGGGVPMAHVHPNQSETFEVLEGELSLKVGRDKLVAQAGDVVTVSPGTVHKFRNDTDRIVRFRCTVTPSLGFEQFLQTICALGADGKLGKRGMPGPAPARGDRERDLRRRACPLRSGMDAEGGPLRRRRDRPTRRLRADL